MKKILKNAAQQVRWWVHCLWLSVSCWVLGWFWLCRDRYSEWLVWWASLGARRQRQFQAWVYPRGLVGMALLWLLAAWFASQ